uniref:SERTA domain-containing protein 1 n=1 Tax=Euleptes europaea TaxID=460621 RepID=UPI00254179A8|nr:SERTA domain-containing protein 1 [Euleptes europaea]
MLGKGQKRKRSEEEAGPVLAPPSSALFSISVSKLHQSLQRGEPDLRHLVLVANTLRRIQVEMEPASVSGPQPAPGGGAWPDDSDSLPGPLQGPCGRTPMLPPSLAPVDQPLLSSMDASIFSILQDLTSVEGFSDPLCPSVAQPAVRLSTEPGRTAQPCLGPLELLGPGGALLEEGLDGLFEDIDTSMYDCDPWPSSKEACSGTEAGRQDCADLDYLLDVLMGAEDL